MHEAEIPAGRCLKQAIELNIHGMLAFLLRQGYEEQAAGMTFAESLPARLSMIADKFSWFDKLLKP
jgi:hypothetical protein